MDIPHWTPYLFTFVLLQSILHTTRGQRMFLKYYFFSLKNFLNIFKMFQWFPVHLRSNFKTVTWPSVACRIYLKVPLGFAYTTFLFYLYTSDKLTVSHSQTCSNLSFQYFLSLTVISRRFILFSQSKLDVPLIFSHSSPYSFSVALIPISKYLPIFVINYLLFISLAKLWKP